MQSDEDTSWSWNRRARALLCLSLSLHCSHHYPSAAAFSTHLDGHRRPQHEQQLENNAIRAHSSCNIGRAATLLRSTDVSAEETSTAVVTVTEASELIQSEIHVQESPLQQKIDEHSLVILGARLVGDEQCESYLLQKLDGNNNYQAHFSGSEELDLDQFISIFHRIVLHYLSIEYELYEKERDEGSSDRFASQLKILVDSSLEKGLAQKLGGIGFSLETESQGDGLGIDIAKYMPFLNEFAFRHRGTEQGVTSLQVLQILAKRRISFDFSDIGLVQEGTVISHQKQLVPPSAVDEVMDIVEEIKSRQWLSTNPDSVDGLPSLHLNLITNGKPLFDKDENGDDGDTTFPQCISKMVDVLRPHLYSNLLPSVRQLTNSSTVEISDVFIRNYGKMEHLTDEDESATRYGLSAHYDVTASSTCVITLDSTASTGRNGLYTIMPTSGFGANSHAALRRFFPLQKGDGVVHTFDILHGVDVDPRLNQARTSLIVWFTDDKSEDQSINQPWLLNPKDDIGEFVLGLALESMVEEDGSQMMLKNAVDSYALYLSSASCGNIFAMTSLAQMLCDDNRIPESEYKNIFNILASRDESNPFLPSDDDTHPVKELANALWYHAAIYGGHMVAQVSLADELMLKYMTIKDNLSSAEQESMLSMAAVLFTMASAQGHDGKMSLNRLMNVECERLSGLGIDVPSDEFFASPVVKVLLFSM